MLPASGSTYAYIYATMGELAAWVIGWDLILEYTMGSAAVAVGWSGYAVSLLRGFGSNSPPRGRHRRAGPRRMAWCMGSSTCRRSPLSSC